VRNRDDLMRPSSLRLISLWCGLSGAAGLIYEVIWTRQFAEIVGATAPAMSAVFAVFMLGLAGGAGMAGRLRLTPRGALSGYALLQLGIAVTALAAGMILRVAGMPLAWWRPESLSLALGYDLAVAGLVLGMPILLMGATLPLVVTAARGWPCPEEAVARLYGWNTLGAAVGAGLAGFLLIWQLGVPGTMLTAAVANLVAGLGAGLLARRMGIGGEAPDVGLASVTGGQPASRLARFAAWRWAALAAVGGGCVLACEVLWGRLARFLLGERTMAVAVLLMIFIAGLGGASMMVGWWQKRRHARNTTSGAAVGWAFLAAAGLHLVLVPLACRALGVTSLPVPLLETCRRLGTAWLLIFPPAAALGLLFPLILCGAADLAATPGRAVGRLSMINSLGAAVGATVATWALCRWLGTLGGFLVVSWVMTVLGAGLLWRHGRTMGRVAAGGLLAGALAASCWWPRNLVWLRSDETLVAVCEDEYGIQVLAKTRAGTWRVRNNRLHLVYDLGHPATAHAQQMAAHLSVLLARQCHEVLNIGTGYGITAGAFTRYPEVTSIETIELLPFMIAQQPRFAEYNFALLSDPRVRLIQGDGRQRLAGSPRRFDIISVNVLDPYLPGSASLYTVEFWQLARARLNPGGAYVQLFWGDDLPLLTKGLCQVFPTVLFFPAYGGSAFNVVAFAERLAPEQLPLQVARIGPAAAAALGEILPGVEPMAYLTEEYWTAWTISREFQRRAAQISGRCHSDDYPLLEYRWSSGDRWISMFDSPLVRE